MSDYSAGVDESGKGDYFGPLVIAAAAISVLERPLLDELNVRDSKLLTDQRALSVAARLRREIPHALVVIMPQKYNELYARIGNLNKLLAWGHARAIENILEKVDCASVISDQFAKSHVLDSALMEKGRTVEVLQQVRGEAQPAVAAASIIARAEFLDRLQKLAAEFGTELPKGGGSNVDAAGAGFVRKHGEAALSKVAKLHFKNTGKVHARLGTTS